MRGLVAFSLFASTEAVYQLRWLGDFQTGTWMSDAAEDIAYDPSTKRALLSSAESGVVKAISVVDPVNLQEVASVDVGAITSTRCNAVDCTYEDFDFGGGSAHSNAEGLASEVRDTCGAA